MRRVAHAPAEEPKAAPQQTEPPPGLQGAQDTAARCRGRVLASSVAGQGNGAVCIRGCAPDTPAHHLTCRSNATAPWQRVGGLGAASCCACHCRAMAKVNHR